MGLKKLGEMLKLFCVLCLTANLSVASPKFEELSILVSSTDKYSQLWDPFFKLLFRQWPSLKTENQDIDIFLISNQKAYLDPRIKNIQIPQEESWSDSMKTALSEVKTSYVLILLDDYFLTQVKEERLKAVVEMVVRDDIPYVELMANDLRYVNGGLYEGGVSGVSKKSQYDDFRTSLQPCLWKTEALKFLLRSGESPWDFESPGSVRSQGMRGAFLAVTEDKPIDYLNMVYRGFLNSTFLDKVKQDYGIEVPPGQLLMDKDNRLLMWYRTRLPKIVYYDIVVPCKNLFTKIFS